MGHLIGESIGHHLPEVQGDDTVTQAHQQVHVVLDQANGDTVFVGIADQLADGLDPSRGDARDRLVEQEQLRLCGKPDGEGERLLPAVGELPRILVAALAHSRELQHLLRFLQEVRFLVADPLGTKKGADGPRLPLQLVGMGDVFEHGEAAEQQVELESPHHPQPGDTVGTHSGDVLALKVNLSGGRFEKSRDEVEQRRLAGTVRPDDAEDFPFLDVKVEPIDRVHAAEALPQVVDLKQWFHLRPPLPR